MIATSRLVGDTEVPVLGVNFGGLGYLAEFRIEELYTALESILSGNYRLDKRVMLAVQLPGDLQRAQAVSSRSQRRGDKQIGTGTDHRD